jgi:hypothetical protein
LRVLAALLTAAVLAGCGATASHEPQPSEAHSAAAQAKVDVQQLNTGDYTVTPLPPLGTAGTIDAGRRAEAHRMAPFVVGPWQVDPSLTKGAPPVSIIITDTDMSFFTGTLLLSPILRTASLAGFVSDRHSTDEANPVTLRNGVVRLADDATAAAAVADMVFWAQARPRESTTFPVLTEPIREIPVPGYPNSKAVVQVYSDGGAIVQDVTVLTAHGPYLLAQVARSPAGPDAAAALAARTLDLQIPLIDSMPPGDPSQYSALPLDPTGLVARTEPLPPTEATPLSGTAYPPAGAAHGEDDPTASLKLWADAGVDEISIGQTTVYQARDADAAAALAGQLADAAAQRSSTQAAAPVPGMPASTCARVADATGLVPKYQCLATADRYVLKSSARDFTRAQQQLAAQYRMLTP